jgi:hypothetical protein
MSRSCKKSRLYQEESADLKSLGVGARFAWAWELQLESEVTRGVSCRT